MPTTDAQKAVNDLVEKMAHVQQPSVRAANEAQALIGALIVSIPKAFIDERTAVAVGCATAVRAAFDELYRLTESGSAGRQ
jgi:hypothetical protein